MFTRLRSITFAALLGILLAVAATSSVRAQTMDGTVKDAANGTPLPFASIVLMQPGSSDIFVGSSTDDDGRYRMENVPSGRYTLVATYVGYRPERFEFVLAEGAARTLNILMESEATVLEPVVVTSSGQQEKMLDAVASMSVLTSEEIEGDVVPSAVDALRNTPGIDIARTGIDRREIVVRGFSNTFSGAAYVLTDYRQSAIPSLGVNAFNMMPISSIDLERVEVLRGPAGALYGPGVDDGVIHFISKNPFDYPGTTLVLSGGQQSLAGGQLRHAGVIRGRLGYKINGLYLKAQDWKLDPTDPVDAEQILNYHQTTARMTDVSKANLNGMMVYRFSPSTSLTAGAGYGSATSVFLSDIGTLQSDGFGYRYAQLRLRSGRFFAQAYVNKNDTGDSFVYSGPRVASSLSGKSVIDRSMQLNFQAQHGFGLFDEREQITVGVDFERTNPVTDGTITGRNESDDLIVEYGAYAQSRTAISEKLNATVAARLDYDNIFEEIQFSPRAAVVYKPAPGQALRATYNRSFTSPSTNSLFLDLIARDPDQSLPLKIRARGAAHGFTFAHNSAYAAFAGTDLVASSLPEATRGQHQPVGLHLDQVYASIYSGLEKIPASVIQDELCRMGVCISEENVSGLKQLLAPAAGTDVQGFTRGDLGILNVTTGEFETISTVSDIAPLKQSTTHTFEAGYKGIIGSKMILAVDAYYSIKKNFIRGLQLETPFVFVPLLRSDLETAMTAGIEGNEPLATVLGQLGIPPELVAQFIAELAKERLPSAGTPIASVQPVENDAGIGNMPELMMTYRNFGRVEYYGIDASLQVMLDDRTNVYGGLSYVSDNFFDHEDLGESNPDLSVALNASALKARAGFSYSVPIGFSFSLGGRYSEGFIVQSGPYNGEIEDWFVLDAGAGFDFGRYAPGLRLDVTVQNVLDNAHREFIGAPKMGRLGIAQVTYTM